MTETRATYDLTMEQLAQAPVAEQERPRIDLDEWQRYIDDLLAGLREQGGDTSRCPYCHKQECSH